MDLINFLAVLLLITLSTCAVLNVWFHGSIFAGWRARMQAWQDSDGIKSFVGKLMSCKLCMAFHVPIWLYALFYLTADLTGITLFKLPVYWLTVVQLVLELVGEARHGKQ